MTPRAAAQVAAPSAASATARGALGLPMVAAGLVALAIAAYLAITRLLDVPSVCGPLAGCATVANSEWSTVAGIPVAALGSVGSALALAGAFAWWRRASRNGLLVAYLVGLASLPVLAWLTYLELFVIHAICDWCVAYAATTIVAWLLAVAALRRTSQRTP